MCCSAAKTVRLNHLSSLHLCRTALAGSSKDRTCAVAVMVTAADVLFPSQCGAGQQEDISTDPAFWQTLQMLAVRDTSCMSWQLTIIYHKQRQCVYKAGALAQCICSLTCDDTQHSIMLQQCHVNTGTCARCPCLQLAMHCRPQQTPLSHPGKVKQHHHAQLG